MIFASVPVLQPPDELRDTWPQWRGEQRSLLIVDNTPDRAWESLAAEEGWSYLTFERNLGVCASWNAARAWFLAADNGAHHMLFLFSGSVRFDDGLTATMQQLLEAANWKGCQTQYGPHGIAWSRAVFDRVGTFDECYWPGYFGDTDWFYRCILEGIISGGPAAMPRIEINAPEPEDGRAINRTGMITNMECCAAYYEAKHGGPPSAETFATPFDSGLPTSWWSPAYRPGMELVDLTTTRYR